MLYVANAYILLSPQALCWLCAAAPAWLRLYNTDGAGYAIFIGTLFLLLVGSNENRAK